MAIVVAVCNYLFHFPHWVSFQLVPILITIGFAFSVMNDVRKMRRRPAA
jgi:hypothetical protein